MKHFPALSSPRNPSCPHSFLQSALGPLAVLLFCLPLAKGLAATTSARTNVRLAPGDVFCPTGLTFGETRPGFDSSTEAVFDRGAFETSFRSPGNGWVYVTLTTDSEIHLDNVMAIPRGELFAGDSDLFESTTCHRDGDPTYPMVRVHAFDPAALPGGTWFEPFAMPDLDGLKDKGWELESAVLDATLSAVELLPPGDQAAVTVDCPGGGALCPLGTSSLLLPAGARVRFPMQLWVNTDFLLQLWVRSPAGARLDVRVDDFSSCPDASDGVFIEHSSDLEIEILDAELKGGIDPEIFLLFALYVDQSDTFGKVTIDGESHDIVQIDNDDNPKWDGRARFAVTDLADPASATIKIEMWDNDEFDNAHVDLDSDPADRDLDLTVDLCRMQIEGDLSADMQGVIEARGDSGSGDDQGILRFRINTPTGRPLSSDDLAVVDLDFVQVVHRTRYAVTERPGVVMVSLANNFTTEITTEVLVEAYGPGGFFVSRRFPVTLDPESKETFYFFDDVPILPPGPTPGVESFLGINVHVDPDGVHTGGIPPGDCRLDNDFVGEKQWKIVETDSVELTWCKVARTLELTSLVSDAKFNDIKDLGTSYIRAIYPTAGISSVDCPVPMPYTPTFAALDFIGAVLNTFGIPFDAVLPFAMVWDMNTFATLGGMNKVLGVLPYSGWYEQFEGWDTVVGNSLGEAAPHAVIFLPEIQDDDGDRHVKVTLPAHELSHTYGVSGDPSLKDAILCGTSVPGDPFMIGDLLCGATGGLDEYKAKDPARVRGNPATGYWVKLGIEDPRLDPLAGAPQCDRHCFMGQAGENQLEDWQGQGRWIDVTDWELLLDRLRRHPDPEVLYVSGMIDPADNIFIGPWFRLPAGIPDRVDGDAGGYQLRFYDGQNNLLQEVGFQATFGASDTDATPPITFFGFTVPWVPGTERVDIDRSPHDQTIPPATIVSRQVSDSVPTVTLFQPVKGPLLPSSGTLDLEWEALDDDGDPLSTVIMASLDGDTWSVAQGWIEPGTGTAAIPVELFRQGTFLLKAVVTDGIHSAESESIEVQSLGAGWLFLDGFETGDVTRWSSSN